jgi:tRNA modification GTPase
MKSIAATITSPGAAAVSITRISGEDSWAIANCILEHKDLQAWTMKLTWLIDPASQERVDEVLVLAFKAPRSYTGEDVIEIHSHGGPYITQRILEICLEAGATLAKPGEFTERAFLNHKLDLSQAESIMDLISARTKLSSANAIKLFEGTLGKAITELRAELLDLMGALTAGIDFPDEVGDYDPDLFTTRCTKVIERIDELLAGASEGRILREGYRVALVGAPNAGKSSLLNTLLEDERAIVTDIPGTTRDLIEEVISINGLPVILMDTAGIRDTEDLVEQLGVERSERAIKDADLVLVLTDMSVSLRAAGEAISPSLSLRGVRQHDEAIQVLEKELSALETIPAEKLIKIGTKLDLQSSESSAYNLCISTLSKTNIDTLKELIYKRALLQPASSIKINERQADLLRRARAHLSQALNAKTLAQDFWTIDLKSAVADLGEITGAVLTEELLDNIFARFCIGK